jgi:hypothetical protein
VGDQSPPPSSFTPPELLELPELEPLLAPELASLPPELEPLDPPPPDPLELPELVVPELEPLPAPESPKLPDAWDPASVALVSPPRPESEAPPPPEQPNAVAKQAREKARTQRASSIVIRAAGVANDVPQLAKCELLETAEDLGGVAMRG